MKIVQYPLPDIRKMETTRTAEAVTSTDNEVDVQNTADFFADDYVVVEQVGNEFAELMQINTITAPDNIEFTNNFIFSHQLDTCIRKTPYNEARLYRSADGETYSHIFTKPLDFQDKHNLITFMDGTGSDDYWYKVEYWNSTVGSGVMSSPIKTLTDTGFISVEDFKKETGIEGENEQIATALRFSAENIMRNLYVKQQAEFITPDTNFIIKMGVAGCSTLEFADSNFDGKIDGYDFVAWEEAQDGTRTYVTSDIVAVDVDRHRITFGTPRPTGSNKLKIEYYVTFRKLTEMTFKMRRLQMLYAVNYIYQNIPFKRLQKGISNWSLNGVSISFDSSSIKGVIEDNKKEIAILLKEIAKLYTRFTMIRRPPMPSPWIKSTLRWQSDNVPVP